MLKGTTSNGAGTTVEDIGEVGVASKLKSLGEKCGVNLDARTPTGSDALGYHYVGSIRRVRREVAGLVQLLDHGRNALLQSPVFAGWEGGAVLDQKVSGELER
jgi:hypothetical protein